ncbi:MAG: hypothetical protein Q3974_07600, partial [Rothia sp. (in: high G+C Gram-positive bacteria)]|nr:hypothetical protein [Rothia sp. (in: high G+C Gram-positive bacteria)]
VTTPAETPSVTATTPAAETTPTASESAAVAVAGGTPGSSTGAEVAQPAATPSTVENIVNEAQNNAPAVTGDVQPAQGTASAEESLAYTGFSGVKIAAAALGLLALGTVIVVAARRRQA